MVPTLPPPLAEDLLALRTSLPLKPAPVTLTGKLVQLRPLALDDDIAPLYACSNGEPITIGEYRVAAYDAEQIIWRYTFAGPFANETGFQRYCVGQVDAPNGRCFCVVDRATDRPVGMTNFMNNSPEHLKIELGGIWYSPLVQGRGFNTEATYLMLQHVFGLGYQRVEWKCNARNERSRRTALRMGFRFEGVQERHMIIKDRARDTAWFRILADEWPAVAERLAARLARPID